MKEFLRKALRITLKIFLWFIGLSIFSVILFRFIPPPFTPLMLIRCVEQKIDGKPMKLNKDWVALDKISKALPLAVIASEDQNFTEHFGLDFEAIQKARDYNAKHDGKKKRGASTISQQTAKNLFLWPTRNFIRKGFEVYFTFLIEVFWSKERIMEVYLNIIEMGNGIYGAEAASRTYFNKPASKLSISESATIAAILPNPRRYSASKPSPYVLRRKNTIIKFMGMIGKVDW